MMCSDVMYCTVLNCTVLHCTVLCCNSLWWVLRYSLMAYPCCLSSTPPPSPYLCLHHSSDMRILSSLHISSHLLSIHSFSHLFILKILHTSTPHHTHFPFLLTHYRLPQSMTSYWPQIHTLISPLKSVSNSQRLSQGCVILLPFLFIYLFINQLTFYLVLFLSLILHTQFLSFLVLSYNYW